MNTLISNLITKIKKIKEKNYESKKPSINQIKYIGLIFAIMGFLDIFTIVGPHVVTADSQIYFGENPTVKKIKEDKEWGRFYSFFHHRISAIAFHQSMGWEGEHSEYKNAVMMIPPNIGAIHDILHSDGGSSGLLPKYISEIWGDPSNMGFINKTVRLGNQDVEFSRFFHRILQIWGDRKSVV